MKQIDGKDKYVLVLERGEELMGSLEEFTKKSDLTAAWLSGLGGASRLTLGFYDLKKRDYIWQDFTEPLEIVNLTGNLSTADGLAHWHIHGTFSGPDYQAVSGHVKSLTIGLTGELLITPLETALTRQFDDATGLKLIDRL